MRLEASGLLARDATDEAVEQLKTVTTTRMPRPKRGGEGLLQLLSRRDSPSRGRP